MSNIRVLALALTTLWINTSRPERVSANHLQQESPNHNFKEKDVYQSVINNKLARQAVAIDKDDKDGKAGQESNITATRRSRSGEKHLVYRDNKRLYNANGQAPYKMRGNKTQTNARFLARTHCSLGYCPRPRRPWLDTYDNLLLLEELSARMNAKVRLKLGRRPRPPHTTRRPSTTRRPGRQSTTRRPGRQSTTHRPGRQSTTGRPGRPGDLGTPGRPGDPGRPGGKGRPGEEGPPDWPGWSDEHNPDESGENYSKDSFEEEVIPYK